MNFKIYGQGPKYGLYNIKFSRPDIPGFVGANGSKQLKVQEKSETLFWFYKKREILSFKCTQKKTG